MRLRAATAAIGRVALRKNQRFIEHNWNLPSAGSASFGQKAGTLLKMSDFMPGHDAGKLFIDPSTGEPL